MPRAGSEKFTHPGDLIVGYPYGVTVVGSERVGHVVRESGYSTRRWAYVTFSSRGGDALIGGYTLFLWEKSEKIYYL